MRHTIKELKLDNGAEGLIVHVPGVDVVRILVEFRAGFDLNSWEKYELPHVMEHMMFTNKTYPKPRQFSREIEKNGAFNNAYTSSTSLEYDYECADFEAQRITELVALQISEPTFPEGELATELGNVAEELNGNISDPGRTAQYNLFVAASGAPTLQTRIDQLADITTQDLKAHYKKTHTPGNMRFVLAGDTDFDGLSQALNVKSLPKGATRLELPYIPTRHLQEPVVEFRDIPQIYYSLFSIHKARFSYRELIAARIISSLLTDGFSSTLYGAAREKGLAYGLSMGISTDENEASLHFAGAVSPDHAKEYFDLAHKEIEKVITSRVDDAQFEATKVSLRGQRARQYQKVSNLVGYYDSYFTIGYNRFEYYEQLLDEITKEEAIETFKRLLGGNCWGMSLVGNTSKKEAKDYHQQLAPLFVA